MKPQYNILDHLTEKVLSKEMSIQQACEVYIRLENPPMEMMDLTLSPLERFQLDVIKNTPQFFAEASAIPAALLVTTFEVIQE